MKDDMKDSVTEDVTPPLHGFGPVLAPNTRLMVLGSFPGVASLAQQAYYAHPRNQFWPILSALWAVDLVRMSYPGRLDVVRARGLGLWDVYARCRREGSLDADIEAAEPNDFSGLRAQAPGLVAMAHNGGESARWMPRLRALGFEVHRLPSTSPANASWPFERKLAAWRTVLAAYDLA